MRYTVFEKGRPIGETDLSFARTEPCLRFGWFHPNALGETLMPVVGAVLPALRALHRLEQELHSSPESPPASVRRSSEFADWSEAMHHLAQLDLELRRPDGTVVPTEQISLQDTDALHALVMEECESSGTPWDDDIDIMHLGELADEDAELDADIEADRGMLAEWDRERELADWTPLDDAEPAMGRYQIFVVLRDDGDVP